MSKTYNSDLQTLNVNLQSILNTIDSLPEASNGVELPELTNEAVVSEVFEGKEVINSNGEKVTGTFTIDTEMSTQTDLISQIATALAEKAAPSGGVELPPLIQPATGSQILEGYDAIDDSGNRIVGTIPNTEVDYYECPLDTTTGTLYPLMAINYGGYVPDGYIFNFSYQLDTKEGTTIIPTSSEQIAVPAGTYCTGDIKVGAASGGSGYEWTPFKDLPTTYSGPDSPGGPSGSNTSVYYLEIPSDVGFVMFRAYTPGSSSQSADAGFVYWQTTRSGANSFQTTFKTNHTMETITCSDVSTSVDRILQITVSDYTDSYFYLFVKQA